MPAITGRLTANIFPYVNCIVRFLKWRFPARESGRRNLLLNKRNKLCLRKNADTGRSFRKPIRRTLYAELPFHKADIQKELFKSDRFAGGYSPVLFTVKSELWSTALLYSSGFPVRMERKGSPKLRNSASPAAVSHSITLP